MDSTVLTRGSLADLIEQHSAALVSALRSPGAHASSPFKLAPWKKVADHDEQTYSWPDGIEHYTPFEIWESQDDGGAVRIGMGRVTKPRDLYGKERYWWLGFAMLGSQIHRPITVFNEADNYATTGDLVAVIKGKGPSRRAMYAVGDELPEQYSALPVDAFQNRISGPHAPNRLAVVAANGDREVMLDHALIQWRLRSK